MPEVSIILTVYNKPQWLAECLDSVMSQTFSDWELIVMEDNSPTPQVRAIIDRYDDPRIIKYFSQVTEDQRYLHNRYAFLINQAVRQFSTGRYITYLTDDDYYLPTRLEKMVEYLDTHPNHHVVYGSLYNVDRDGNHAGERLAVDILDSAWDRVDHGAVMHRREVFFEVDGWEDNAGTWGGGDSYFWRRISWKGYKFYPIPDFVGAHRYHENSVQWLMSNQKWPPNA